MAIAQDHKMEANFEEVHSIFRRGDVLGVKGCVGKSKVRLTDYLKRVRIAILIDLRQAVVLPVVQPDAQPDDQSVNQLGCFSFR